MFESSRKQEWYSFEKRKISMKCAMVYWLKHFIWYLLQPQGQRYLKSCECWNIKLDCRQVKALMKQAFNAAGQIFWTLFTVPMLKVLNLNTVGFRQYSKKYCNLHIAFILGSGRCSELNWVSLLTEFSWLHFLNKDLKTLYWQLYWSNWNVCIINIWQLC